MTDHEHHPARLTPDSVRGFTLAGNATLTLVSKKTGSRFTYRIRGKDELPLGGPARHTIYFVQVLTGPDNEQDFAYLGCIRPDKRSPGATYGHGRKSNIDESAPSASAFACFWHAANCGHIPPMLEVWHEGKCGRCGRKLTVPESIERGIGPECAGKIA